MKIILQSHDRFDDLGEFDPDTGELRIRSKKDVETEGWDKRTAGFFSVLPTGPAALYRIDHDLLFSQGGSTYAVTEDVFGRVVREGSKRRFVLSRGDCQLALIDYDVADPVIPPELDFTATEPEHYDFFLFVTNLLRDPARRRLTKGFARE